MAVQTNPADPEALQHDDAPAPGPYDGAKVGRIFAAIFGIAICLIVGVIYALSQ